MVPGAVHGMATPWGGLWPIASRLIIIMCMRACIPVPAHVFDSTPACRAHCTVPHSAQDGLTHSPQSVHEQQMSKPLRWQLAQLAWTLRQGQLASLWCACCETVSPAQPGWCDGRWWCSLPVPQPASGISTSVAQNAERGHMPRGYQLCTPGVFHKCLRGGTGATSGLCSDRQPQDLKPETQERHTQAG